MTRVSSLAALSCAAVCLIAAAPPVQGPPAPAATTYGPPSDSEAVVAPVQAPPGIPPALLEAAETATANYPTIRNAEAELRAARTDLRGAHWLRFPSVQVEALALRGGKPGYDDPFTANIVGEQPIYNFGRLDGTIDRARATTLMRVAALDQTAQQVAIQVSDAFYNLALAARRTAVLESGLDQHRALLQTIQNRVRQEVSPQADLDLAMSRTAQLQQDLEQAKAARNSALAQLVQLVGTNTQDFGMVPEYDAVTMHPSDQGAMARALNCDPGLARLRGEVLIAQADVRIAKGSIMPEVVGQVSQNEITGTRVGIVLRAQTGNGLSKLADAEAARTRVDAALFNVAAAEREVREQLQLDFVNNRSARERVAANTQASMTSELVTESYKRQFITGRRTWLDVMNASREATNSKLSVAEAETSAMASNAHIWLRTCGWQPRPLDSGLPGAKK